MWVKWKHKSCLIFKRLFTTFYFPENNLILIVTYFELYIKKKKILIICCTSQTPENIFQLIFTGTTKHRKNDIAFQKKRFHFSRKRFPPKQTEAHYSHCCCINNPLKASKTQTSNSYRYYTTKNSKTPIQNQRTII